MNPNRPLEDFPFPFASKHLKGKSNHSSAKYSASETKPLIHTDRESDSGHKHIALVLSNPQLDELNQKETTPCLNNISDIPLTVLPTYTTLADHIVNRPASHLQNAVRNGDVEATVSILDKDCTAEHDARPSGHVHGQTSHCLTLHVSPDVDNVRYRTRSAESLMGTRRLPVSQPDHCRKDVQLPLAQSLQGNDQGKHCSTIADPRLTPLNPNHQIDASKDQSTIVNSNSSDAITFNSSLSQEDQMTCLFHSSCPSDGNKTTTSALQPSYTDFSQRVATFPGLETPESAYVHTVTLPSEKAEHVEVYVPRANVSSEIPHQIHLTENRNIASIPDHNKACLDNSDSLLFFYPHSDLLHKTNTSPAHHVDRHSASTSLEESAFQPKHRVSDVFFPHHVTPDTDFNHTSSVATYPSSSTHAVKSGCLYPSVSNKLDVCFCGNSFRIHYPKCMNNHGSHSELTRDRDGRIHLAEKPEPTAQARCCNRDFISSVSCSKRLIHSPAGGIDNTVTPQTRHSELSGPNKFSNHVTDTANGTCLSEQIQPNLSDINSIHTDSHRTYCNTNASSKGPHNLHSCAVQVCSSPPLAPSSVDVVPSHTHSCVYISPKTAHSLPGQCGQTVHCDQQCRRTVLCGENAINNTQMAESAYTPELKLVGGRACVDPSVLESQENLVGCKRDSERNSGLSSIDSGHPVNKEGSLPRSNTSELGLLKVSSSTFSDREVPNYSILCIVATVLNPVFGLAAFLCNHYAQRNFRLHRRAQANNLYFATITISTVSIFLTLVGAVLLISHIAVVHSETKWAATTPSPDLCESRLFGYDESLKTFFNIDFKLYCEITKNEKIMDALKRFWLEDIHNKKKYVAIEASDRDYNNTQNEQSDNISSANHTLIEASSLRAGDPFGDLEPAEAHRDAKSNALTTLTPQLSKPVEDSRSSHNTILSSNDGPVVPPELEEEYRQYLEGHTRTKVGSDHPFQHGSMSDKNLSVQTPATTDEPPTADTTAGSNDTTT